jgi:dienelactone hydrolase
VGVSLFLVAIIVEAALAAFCITTKSNQQKARSIIRIVALVFFLLLTFIQVIDWSLRYYALAALLFVLAAMGALDLLRSEEKKNVHKPMRVVLRAIGMTMLIFLLTLPAIIFPQYTPLEPSGEYRVATAAFAYTDTSRVETYTNTGEHRKLNVQFWHPEAEESTYPLIVFSHGGISTRLSNESLYLELASNGYVVCAVDHTYHCLVTKDEDGRTIFIDRAYMQELSAEDAKSDRQQSYECYQKWMKTRTDDMNFVLDHILSQVENDAENTVYELIDKASIGVMGHSLGGAAALGVGRMRDDVSAIVALESPFLCDIKGVADGEFAFVDESYPVPVLNVYSDSSWSHLAEWPQYAENYALLSASDATAFNVHISGVGHFTLTDLALSSPFLTRMFNGQKSTTSTEHCLKTINKVCLEFFDCYLKGEGGG